MRETGIVFFTGSVGITVYTLLNSPMFYVIFQVKFATLMETQLVFIFSLEQFVKKKKKKFLLFSPDWFKVGGAILK